MSSMRQSAAPRSVDPLLYPREGSRIRPEDSRGCYRSLAEGMLLGAVHSLQNHMAPLIRGTLLGLDQRGIVVAEMPDTGM